MHVRTYTYTHTRYIQYTGFFHIMSDEQEILRLGKQLEKVAHSDTPVRELSSVCSCFGQVVECIN